MLEQWFCSETIQEVFGDAYYHVFNAYKKTLGTFKKCIFKYIYIVFRDAFSNSILIKMDESHNSSFNVI